MAVIHRTTMVPGKLELLAGWLPRQDWYAGGPALARAGGFRLDDPDGEVGIEFLVARDAAAAYLVPLTYRGAPLEGAGAHLIGTAEHGVLGPRWIYDGTADPVLLGQLAELIQGRARPQHASQSDTPDDSVRATAAAALPGQQLTIAFARRLSPLAAGAALPGAGEVTGVWTAADGAEVRSLLVTARPAVD